MWDNDTVERVLKTYDGRWFAYDLMENSGCLRPAERSWTDSERSFKDGERKPGLTLFNIIFTNFPQYITIMQNEANDRINDVRDYDAD